MTIQEKAIKQLERISNHLSALGEKEDYTDLAIQSLEQESKIEEEIRKEIKNLTTYRVNNSHTDLVSVKAVERVLNLVFRGCRDKEPQVGHWLYNNGSYKCEFCGHEITGREEDLNYCPFCGAKMESEDVDTKGVI